MKKFFEYFQNVIFIAIVIGNIIVLPTACVIPMLSLKTKLAKVTKEYDDKLAVVKKELYRSEDYLFSLIKQYAIDNPKEVKELATKIEDDNILQGVSRAANMRRVKELKEMQKLLQEELNLFKAYGYE